MKFHPLLWVDFLTLNSKSLKVWARTKKMPETSLYARKIPTKNLPLVQTGPGGEYVKRIMPDQVKKINLKKAVSGAINRLRGK